MRAALCHFDAFNRCAADETGHVGAAKHHDGVLHVAFFSVGLDVVADAGAFAGYAFAQDALDGGV